MTARITGKIKAQRLHQKHVRQVLGNEDAAWTPPYQLAAHAIERPAQLFPVLAVAQVNYSRHGAK